ncbi:hypothetical protein LQK93_01074 [Terrabacter sp. BE26]
MKPNSYVVATPEEGARFGKARSTNRSPGPSGVARALRPFGYLCVATVWTALSVVSLLLPAALPFGLWSSNPRFSSKQFIAEGDIVPVLLFLIFAVAVLVPLLGYAYVALPLACLPLAVLAWTYVARSLSPGYRRQRLSCTRWSRELIGAPNMPPVAMSLLPVRQTTWTRAWTVLMGMGWRPSWDVLVAGMPVGLASFVVSGWAFWPMGEASRLAWAVGTAFLVVATVLLVGRSYRSQASRQRFT